MRSNFLVIPGAELRAARERLGLSRLELAKMLDVSPNAIYRWEHDRSRPLPIFIRRLAKILKVTPRPH